MLTIGKNPTTRTQTAPIKEPQKFQSPQMSSVNFKAKNNHCGDTVHFGSEITRDQFDEIKTNHKLSFHQKAEQIKAIILDGKDTEASIKSLGKISVSPFDRYGNALMIDSFNLMLYNNGILNLNKKLTSTAIHSEISAISCQLIP